MNDVRSLRSPTTPMSSIVLSVLGTGVPECKIFPSVCYLFSSFICITHSLPLFVISPSLFSTPLSTAKLSTLSLLVTPLLIWTSSTYSMNKFIDSFLVKCRSETPTVPGPRQFLRSYRHDSLSPHPSFSSVSSFPEASKNSSIHCNRLYLK